MTFRLLKILEEILIELMLFEFLNVFRATIFSSACTLLLKSLANITLFRPAL